MHKGKNYLKAQEKIQPGKAYTIEEAIRLAKELAFAKFDETVEVSVNLNVDPKQADQIVRGTVSLPYGTGKKIRVLAFAKGEKEKEATQAGADYAGAEEFIEKINSGWMDFDAVVATPDLMGQVGKLGKILGPRGLMPNPKSGTVTFDVAKIVKELKAGKIEYRVDKAGNIGVLIGKKSFPVENLVANARVFLDSVVRARPVSVKGQYLKSATVSTTMGVAIRLDNEEVLNLAKQI